MLFIKPDKLKMENEMHFYINQWQKIKPKELSLKEKTKEIIILDRTAK